MDIQKTIEFILEQQARSEAQHTRWEAQRAKAEAQQAKAEAQHKANRVETARQLKVIRALILEGLKWFRRHEQALDRHEKWLERHEKEMAEYRADIQETRRVFRAWMRRSGNGSGSKA